MGKDSGDRDDISRLCNRAPGESPNNPYEDQDISDLPTWWQQAIETFNAHGMRPYQPPRFEDGVLKHYVIEQLEDDHDIALRLTCYDPEKTDYWDAEINGRTVGKIGHYRSTEGYSVFEIDSDTFRELIESNL